MRWISDYSEDSCEKHFVRKKLSSGFTAYVSLFGESDPFDRRTYFNVALVIAKKRKAFATSDYFDNRMTGDGGLEGLVFAKQAMTDFEGLLAARQKIAFVVYGSDGRRQKLYERYLTRMGFVKERREGAMVMIKRIDT